jgi:enoyl-CoA hydratase/carnithine racemase
VSHYLYFSDKDNTPPVLEELRALGFTTSERLGADKVNWLVLARHVVVPTAEAIADAQTTLTRIASRSGAEYDGWEIEADREVPRNT